MLGTKEKILKASLENWRKKIDKMIGDLDSNNITQKACLKEIKKLKEKIEKTIRAQEHGIFIE